MYHKPFLSGSSDEQLCLTRSVQAPSYYWLFCASTSYQWNCVVGWLVHDLSKVCSCETPWTTRSVMWCLIPKDLNLLPYHYENLKSHSVKVIYFLTLINIFFFLFPGYECTCFGSQIWNELYNLNHAFSWGYFMLK
jgi:hypothetical protein